MEYDLRNDLFQKLEELDPAYYARTRTGDLMARLTNDLSAVRMAAGPAVMYFANTIAGGAFALAFMLYFSPWLTFIAAVPMAVLPALGLVFGRRIHARFEAVQAHFSDLTTLAQENLAGVRIVRAFRQEQAEVERFGTLNDGYLDKNMKLAELYALMQPGFSIFAGLGMVAVLGVGGTFVLRGTLSIGTFVAFGIYLGMLTWPLIALGWVTNLFQRGAASMTRLLDILDAKPSLVVAAEPRALPAAAAGRSIEFRDVGFHYPSEPGHTPRWVLRHISFSIPAGATIGVVGATASGKSALMDLVPRLFDPQEGEILVDGVPIRELDLGRAAARDRLCAAGELSVQRHHRQQPRLRDERRERRRMGRQHRAVERDDRCVPRQVRYGTRRAWDQPVRRPKATCGPRTRSGAPAEHRSARRRTFRGGHAHGGRDPACHCARRWRAERR